MIYQTCWHGSSITSWDTSKSVTKTRFWYFVVLSYKLDRNERDVFVIFGRHANPTNCSNRNLRSHRFIRGARERFNAACFWKERTALSRAETMPIEPSRYCGKQNKNNRKEQQGASDNGYSPRWHEGTRAIVVKHDSSVDRPKRVSN